MTKRWIFISGAVALFGVGCSHGAPSQPAASAPPSSAQAEVQGGMGPGGMGDKMAAICPMAVPGTQVSASDTSTGETVTFSTTSPDQVADLRSRVNAMADMHNRHHASGDMGGMHGGMHGQGGTTGTGQGGEVGHMPMPPPSTTSVEDTDTGARLVVTPKDPAQLAQLQSAVRAHAEMMQQGHCAMGGTQGH